MMPSNLVIQDSDESDAELSDIATSIDPLQDNITTGNVANTLRDFPPIDQYEQYDTSNNNQVVEAIANRIGNSSESDSNNCGPASFDPNLSVNFDQFLASQSQNYTATGPVSLSQQRRERAWLGEEDEDGAYSSSMKLSERGVCSSSGTSILKRGRTMDAGNIEPQNVVVEGSDVKRRLTMDVFGTGQYTAGNRVGFADSLEGDIGGEVASDQMINSPAKHNGDSTFIEDLETEASNTPNGPSTIRISGPPATYWSEVRSLKQPSGRSKSTQGFDDTAYDTEPMSSIALARAHRTMSSSFISAPPQSSTESTRDELALPPMVQVSITNMRPTSMRKKKPSVTETTGIESDRDELDCIDPDFGGIPKDRYKPRPSRSRSKATVDNSLGSDGSEDNYVEVMVPREDFSGAQTCQASKVGNSIVAEKTNNTEEGMLYAAIHEIPHERRASHPEYDAVNAPDPLEAPKRPLKVAKKKVKRGKTTSVMLKRAVESDVEDDVIWIDEKPENVTLRNARKKNSSSKSQGPERREEINEKALSNNSKGIEEEVALIEKTEDEMDVKLEEVQQIPPNPTATATATAPKKRGRKRKKTSDNLTAEPLLAVAETEPLIDCKKDIQPFTEHDQNIPVSKTNLEKEASNPGSAVDVGTAEKAYQVPQSDEEDQKKPVTDVLASPSHSGPLKLQPQLSATTPAPEQVETPKKSPMISQKGPDKHSPIMVNKKVPYRVGLSRTARIAPLLKVVRK